MPTGHDGGAFNGASRMSVAHIRGWLAVFVAYALLWAGSAVFNTVQVVRALSSVDRLQTQIGTLFIGSLLYIGLVIAFGLGIWLVMRRSHHARRYWLTLLSVKIPASIFTGFTVFTVMRAYARQEGQALPDIDEFQIGELRRLLVTVLWLVYWARSRRVREAFVSGSSSGAHSA
jgi:hypothetical protein